MKIFKKALLNKTKANKKASFKAVFSKDVCSLRYWDVSMNV